MADVTKLAGIQARMLDRAAQMVAPGGLLVFSNCSLDPLEGEAVAEAFVAANPTFRSMPIAAEEAPGFDGAVTKNGYLRITPAGLALGDVATSGADGFFAARFRREN
jgi:16S rRNA (cytosine967-C5)-methyltransferase